MATNCLLQTQNQKPPDSLAWHSQDCWRVLQRVFFSWLYESSLTYFQIKRAPSKHLRSPLQPRSSIFIPQWNASTWPFCTFNVTSSTLCNNSCGSLCETLVCCFCDEHHCGELTSKAFPTWSFAENISFLPGFQFCCWIIAWKIVFLEI